MSWHIEFHANTKAAARHEIIERHNHNVHFPPAAAAAVSASIDLLPDDEGSMIFVRTSGHLNHHESYKDGQVEIVTKLVKVVRHTPAPHAHDDIEGHPA